jgi:hypothetical protein
VPDDQKVEANLKFSDGNIKALDLRPQKDGYRYNEYDYRGNSAGSLTITYSVFDGSRRSFAEMGSALVIPWPSGKCPKCGKDIRYGQGRCMNCGEIPYV